MAKASGSGALPDAVTDALKELAGSVTQDRAKEMILTVLTGAAGTAAGALGGPLVWGGMALLYAALTYRKAAGEKRQEEGTSNALAGILDSLAAHGSQLDGLAGAMAQGVAGVEDLRTRFDQVSVQLRGNAGLMEFVLGEVVAQGDRLAESIADLRDHIEQQFARLADMHRETLSAVRELGELKLDPICRLDAAVSDPPEADDGTLASFLAFARTEGRFVWGVAVGGSDELRLGFVRRFAGMLRKDGWDVGLLPVGTDLSNHDHWSPRKPTLIVVRDASRRIHPEAPEGCLLHGIGHLSSPLARSTHPVRLLLAATALPDWGAIERISNSDYAGGLLSSRWHFGAGAPGSHASADGVPELQFPSVLSCRDVLPKVVTQIDELLVGDKKLRQDMESMLAHAGASRSAREGEADECAQALADDLIAHAHRAGPDGFLRSIWEWLRDCSCGSAPVQVRRLVCNLVVLCVTDLDWLHDTRQDLGKQHGLPAREAPHAEILVAALYNVATRWRDDAELPTGMGYLPWRDGIDIAPSGDSLRSQTDDMRGAIECLTCFRKALEKHGELVEIEGLTDQEVEEALDDMREDGTPIYALLPADSPVLASLQERWPSLLLLCRPTAVADGAKGTRLPPDSRFPLSRKGVNCLIRLFRRLKELEGQPSARTTESRL